MPVESPPLVSVVIPTYNRTGYVCQAIDSALNQTYSNIEVIVVDDGSTDETPEVLARYGDRITVIRKKNGGLSAARNTGIAGSSGDFVAVLDDDDLWRPTKLEVQMPLFDRDDVSMVFGVGEVFIDDTGERHTMAFIGEYPDLHIILRHWFPPIMTHVYRRKVLDELGGFDESLPASEDWDLCLRFAAKYQMRGTPEVVADVRSHSSNASGNVEKSTRWSLMLVQRHAHYHPGCKECARTVAITKDWLQNKLYDIHRNRAIEAARQGKYLLALRERILGLCDHPSHLIRRFRKLESF